MSSDTPRRRFEDIDWDANGGFTLDRQTMGLLLTLGGLTVAFVIDYFQEGPLFAPNPVLREGWDLTQLDWLFMLSLTLFAFYVVVPLVRHRRMTAYYWQEFRKNRAAVLSLAYLLVIFTLGLVGPLLVTRPQVALLQSYQPPVGFAVDSAVPLQCVGDVGDGRCHGSWQFPLGTTGSGKDILALVVLGMRVSMRIGLITSFLIVGIGATVGTVAAYVGGLVDEVLMRYVDIQQVFPSFLLYLLLIYLFGGSLLMFILVFGLFSWGGTARLVRSASLQRSQEAYVDVARCAGADTKHVILRHILPNISGTVITNLTLLIPGLILFEAGLAFLALGDPTIPSWGQTIAAGRSDLRTAWWVSTIPGVFLFLTILAFNFVGDAFRNALDPRSEVD
ncbi:ABC transporter permease [Haloarcula nitratireducens]|uniref:ABC transporter permease n=1 Tax=Haloarcula nitratireducens TaxID=2487749 RepID=A0AAW4PHI6_9EURY|nr:ABC transporter permease [Halomicroarcula nitratireducens]MBX0297394.1 ABC transporter permease [Halomicroarcula nitratireducens]